MVAGSSFLDRLHHLMRSSAWSEWKPVSFRSLCSVSILRQHHSTAKCHHYRHVWSMWCWRSIAAHRGGVLLLSSQANTQCHKEQQDELRYGKSSTVTGLPIADAGRRALFQPGSVDSGSDFMGLVQTSINCECWAKILGRSHNLKKSTNSRLILWNSII